MFEGQTKQKIRAEEYSVIIFNCNRFEEDEIFRLTQSTLPHSHFVNSFLLNEE
jgi:hypothetical protein